MVYIFSFGCMYLHTPCCRGCLVVFTQRKQHSLDWLQNILTLALIFFSWLNNWSTTQKKSKLMHKSNQGYCLFYPTHSSSVSSQRAYITHNATSTLPVQTKNEVCCVGSNYCILMKGWGVGCQMFVIFQLSLFSLKGHWLKWHHLRHFIGFHTVPSCITEGIIMLFFSAHIVPRDL